MLNRKWFAVRKNKAVTITINHTAYERLQKIAQDKSMPEVMRLILEASSEHKGGLYSLLAKLAGFERKY